MSIKNGDLPAMPIFGVCDESLSVNGFGLTKREMFAMAAMQGFCQINLTFDSPQALAAQSVKMADELLAELERTK